MTWTQTPWKGESNLHFDHKLTLNRLPDVRPYLFAIGYEILHELRRHEPMEPLDREQEYVIAGRLALQAERDAGRG